MLTLLLLRHARAHASGPSDAERELTDQGLEQSRGVGKDLMERGLLPDLVLCSTAVRTRQTWHEIANQLQGHTPEVKFLEELYDASPRTVRRLLTEHAELGQTVLVVGHEPIMSMAAADYADAKSERGAMFSVQAGMSTASLAIIELPDLGAPKGTLTELLRRHT